MPCESETRISVAPAARAPVDCRQDFVGHEPAEPLVLEALGTELVARHDTRDAFHVGRDVDLELRLRGGRKRRGESHDEGRSGPAALHRPPPPPTPGGSGFDGIAKRESSIGTFSSIFSNFSDCVWSTPDAAASKECGSIRPDTSR